jgi:V/A-type H+-transporting ATPase subunit D
LNSSTLPTKNNLMRLKDNLRLSKQGRDLLEKKKIILNMEKIKYVKKAKEKKEELDIALQKAYQSYIQAVIETGVDNLIDISNGMSFDDVLDIKYKTIMGVEIPSIVYESKKAMLNYSLYDTTSSVDKTIIDFNKVKDLIIEYAELSNTIIRLEKSIEKVSKRSNALGDMIIPQTEKNISEIQDILEEREREEFTRLKVIKNKIK